MSSSVDIEMLKLRGTERFPVGKAEITRYILEDGSEVVQGPGGHACGPNEDRLKNQDKWYCKPKDRTKDGFYTDCLYMVYRHCAGM